MPSCLDKPCFPINKTTCTLDEFAGLCIEISLRLTNQVVDRHEQPSACSLIPADAKDIESIVSTRFLRTHIESKTLPRCNRPHTGIRLDLCGCFSSIGYLPVRCASLGVLMNDGI